MKFRATRKPICTQVFWFYEAQSPGLGNYFRECLSSDISSLVHLGGIHEMAYGYQRRLSKRFPFAIDYHVQGNVVTVVAVLDCRRDPKWTKRRLQ